MPTVICNTDRVPWVVVPSSNSARRVTITEGGVRPIAGFEAVPLTLVDEGKRTWAHEWPCGDHIARLESPAYDRTDCTWQAGSSGVCSKRAMQLVQQKPADFYVNPSYGMACACCGHQGTHIVYRDPAYARPICMGELA